ncbi:MAG: aldo/keto reductase [Candidatus Omnitrophica bacterium]|nr:aldo/keto reductase [Candidatus Omnitrophota bacterium]
MLQIEKIALGTAQFGLDYGIANKNGKVSKEEVFSILNSAVANNVDTLDTAYSYGDSESIIGEFMSKNDHKFKIISKLPSVDIKDIGSSRKFFNDSLRRLGKKNIYGYLIHDFKNLRLQKEIWDALKDFRDEGRVKKIGVTLYKPEELDYLLENNLDFDLLQVPYNILDQRFDRYLPILSKKKVIVYVRSVFLQGLFFLPLSRIEKDFNKAAGSIKILMRLSLEYQIPIAALCLCFTMLNPFVSKVVIGVESKEQLVQNISLLRYMDSIKRIYKELVGLRMEDEKILLPYNWR